MLFYLFLAFALCFLFWRVLNWFPLSFPSFKFDPSACYTFYGRPGSGKSCYAAWLARKALSSGITVYSNVPIIGCRKFDKSDLGVWAMNDCLIIWDEISIDAHARNWKNNLSPENIEFLKLHRHEGAMICIFSQGFDDMDKVLRTLGSHLYIVRKGLFRTIRAKRVSMNPDIDELTHQPIDYYSFSPLGHLRIFAPSIYKYFDSFCRLGLPEKDWFVFGQSDIDVSSAPLPPSLD